MLKSIEGIYSQGEIKLTEKPDDIPQNTKVIVTFLPNISADTEINKNLSSSQVYHDLDDLAGTWTEEDEAEFIKNTNHFNQIDPQLW
jgi:hypothetical protein